MGFLQGARICSVAVDKSRVFGKGTFSGAFFLPTNRAFWMAPKVCGRAEETAARRPGGDPNPKFILTLSEFWCGVRFRWKT